MGENETKNFPEWKTFENLHLDGNPWHYVLQQKCLASNLLYKRNSEFIEENNVLGPFGDGQLYVQGLINFMDNRVQDGGFQLVPKFHKQIKEFTLATANTLGERFKSQTFIVLPENLPQLKGAQRISVPAGCIVIWNQYTAHGSKPNHSERPRFDFFDN